jgi:hypothetical protein
MPRRTLPGSSIGAGEQQQHIGIVFFFPGEKGWGASRRVANRAATRARRGLERSLTGPDRRRRAEAGVTPD